MIPGKSIIRECSSCGKHMAQRTLMSGNTCGAVYWTDGKREAPMLPELPLLVKCQHCGTLVWIREQIEVKNVDRAYLGKEYSPLMPTLEDYAAFLEKGMNDWQKECYVRHHAWWVGNDPRRESSQTPLNSFEIENLRAFIPLLN